MASAASLTQQQSFQDKVANTSMPDPVAVAVSPDGMNVYVASSNPDQIAVFSRGSNGNLVFQRTQSVSGIGSLTSLAVSGATAGADDLFVGGSGGVVEFQGSTTLKTLSFFKSDTSVGSVSSVSTSSDGQAVYATVPSRNTLDVLSTSSLTLVGNAITTEGASSVAVSGNIVELGTLTSTALVSGLANTVGLFVGEQVSGSGIPAGTTIALINSSSSLTLSHAETSSAAESLMFSGDGPALTGMLSGTTAVTQVSTTAGLYVGEPISGAGIPFGTTITQINSSSSSITLSQHATASGLELLTTIDDYTILSGALQHELGVGDRPGEHGQPLRR